MQFPHILTFESKGLFISHRLFHHKLLVELFYSKKTLTLLKKKIKIKKFKNGLLVHKGEYNAWELCSLTLFEKLEVK